MDTKELLAIVKANGFEAEGLYRYDTLETDGYDLSTLLDKEVADGISLIDYRDNPLYNTDFALMVREGEKYALYIDSAAMD